MKTARKSGARLLAWICVAAVLASNPAGAADILSDATAAADINGNVSFIYGANGALTVVFPAQSASSIPKYTAATIVARTSSGSPAFSGNYIEMGANTVSFKIRSESTVVAPAGVQLVLRSSVSGRAWRNDSVTASPEEGVLVVNQVSFERSSGWTRDGGGDLDAMWQEDLQSVEIIGVRLVQPNRQAMSYTVSDFTVSGDLMDGAPAVLTPLEQALRDRFGVTSIDDLTDSQKAQDTDEDGMTDLVEILSENDDTYANMIFAAEIVSITDDGILIRWPVVAGSSYTVLRAASLLDEFQDLAGAVSMPATYTGYMLYIDATALDAGPYFYKIRREK